MKTNNLFFVTLMVLLAGCQLGGDDEPAVERDAAIDEVKAALSGVLLTPGGKLKSVFEYQGFEHFIGHSDWYYNEEGQVVVTIGVRATNDTSGVSLYGYDKSGNQVLKKSFEKSENGFIWVSTKTSVFDDGGNLLKEYLETVNLGKDLISSFYYNEIGLLAMTQFEDEGSGDRYVYSYDDRKRVSKMRWLSAMDDDTPIREYFYRYNEKG